MLVYRAEDRDGHGPFQNIWIELEDAQRAQRWVAHNASTYAYPTPGYDTFRNGDYPPRDEAFPCGAISLTQWCHWFPGKCAEVLHNEGYFLSVYEVPEENVWIGRRQVVFERRAAKLLRRLDPITLEIVT